MKKQIISGLFIFQFFIYLIPSPSIAQNTGSADSQAGCKSNFGWQQNAPWWGWTPAHDHLISGKANCGQSANRIVKVNTGLMPENLLILFDEAKAFKAEGPEGQLIKNYEIDLFIV